METFSLVAIKLRAERRRKLRSGVETHLTQPTTGEFAHQGHRLDLPDERLISPHGARYMPERRVWDGKHEMWLLQPEPKKLKASPKRKPAPRVVEAIRGTEDAVLARAVVDVVNDGGRPEEVMVRVISRRR